MTTTLESQLKAANIPYPNRVRIHDEICGDIESSGMAQEAACLRERDIRELVEIHATRVSCWLRRYGNASRLVVGCFAYLPVVALTITLFREDAMIDFIAEGGLGMYAILAIGGILLGQEILHAVRLLVVRDHSDHNLDIRSSTLALSCVGMLVFAIGCAFFNFYVVVDKISTGKIGQDLLLFGVKESVTPVVLSFFLVSVLLFVRSGTRTVLQKWRAPLPH